MSNSTPKPLKSYIIQFIITFSAVLMAILAFHFSQKIEEKNKEKQLMTNLLDDLKADANDIKNVIGYDSLRINDLDSLIQMKDLNFEKTENKTKLYDRVFFCFSNMILHNPHNGTFNQLNNQSGYTLIKNRAIIDSLIDYETGKHLLNEQEEFYKSTLLNIYSLKYELMDETIYDNPNQFDKQNGNFLSNANPYLNKDKSKLIKFFNVARDYKKETRHYYKTLLKNHLSLSLHLIEMIKKEYHLN